MRDAMLRHGGCDLVVQQRAKHSEAGQPQLTVLTAKQGMPLLTKLLYGTAKVKGRVYHVFAPDQNKDQDFNTLAMYSVLRLEYAEKGPVRNLFVLNDSGAEVRNKTSLSMLADTMTQGMHHSALWNSLQTLHS